jgi:hypothetical protein
MVRDDYSRIQRSDPSGCHSGGGITFDGGQFLVLGAGYLWCSTEGANWTEHVIAASNKTLADAAFGLREHRRLMKPEDKPHTESEAATPLSNRAPKSAAAASLCRRSPKKWCS